MLQNYSLTLSILIISYNTREMTLRCIQQALAQCVAEEIDSEIIVVDNGSTDGSADAIKNAFTIGSSSTTPAVKLIRSTSNLGFGRANNRGMQVAKGKYILLLNSDAFPKPGAFTTLLNFMESHADAACVGPRLLNEDESLQVSCYKFPSPARITWESLLLTAAFPNSALFGDYRKWPHDTERKVDFVIGACMLVRRETINRVGMFDESFFLYSEETDWEKRMSDHGWNVYFTPDAEVYHLCGTSGKAQADRVFTEFRRGQERYIRKHFGGVGLTWYRIMLTVGSTLRLILFSLFRLFSKNPKYPQEVTLWWRILRWNLGIRGPGLEN